MSQTSVYPREVVKESLARNAAALVLVLNHPSGAAEPLRADEMLTRTLKSAPSLVDVRVLDHLIVEIDASHDALARLVGIDAYEAAGGAVRRAFIWSSLRSVWRAVTVSFCMAWPSVS